MKKINKTVKRARQKRYKNFVKMTFVLLSKKETTTREEIAEEQNCDYLRWCWEKKRREGTFLHKSWWIPLLKHFIGLLVFPFERSWWWWWWRNMVRNKWKSLRNSFYKKPQTYDKTVCRNHRHPFVAFYSSTTPNNFQAKITTHTQVQECFKNRNEDDDDEDDNDEYLYTCYGSYSRESLYWPGWKLWVRWETQREALSM